ncbi:SDR family NAD(P)-dependent oxidoreductase [Streptomyces sp. NPDC000151]|uniref:SDR family NAD(P)-dependent oxidoreductase n=1 Tax=Streptomyces sp. NPDC000151 TaxID=3154244 RepID=UPI00332A1E9D
MSPRGTAAGRADDTCPVAVVTGGARGLGACLAARFFERGHRVAVTDLDGEGARRTAHGLAPTGDSAIGIELDVRDRGAFERALAEVTGRWGTVHVLVNNAGLSRAEPLMEIGPESFRSTVSANMDGAFFGCQVFGGHFAERGYGRIVNIASLAGQNGGTATGAHYAAAKGAVATLTKVFARELAPRGVTVNAISPGPLDLPVVREMLPAEQIERIEQSIPVGRLGLPGFIADMAVLLAGEEAAAVTGACWDANGGLHMR